jgi:hypothetical protein
VLRFRRDRLYLGVEPDRLTLVRLSGAWPGLSSTRVVSSTLLAFEDSATEATRIEALRQELRSPQWQKAVCHVVLSDRLVRYFVAERPPGARNADEVRLAAGLRFEDIFGVAAGEWEIKLDMRPFARRQLGCALRKSFISDVATACATAKSPIASLQPFAVSEFNRSHAAIGGKEGWFAVLGRQGLWVGQKKGHDWLSTHQYALSGDIPAEFSRLMTQEYLRASPSPAATSPRIWLSGLLGSSQIRQGLASSPALLRGAPGWSGQSDEWNTAYRLALSPVWPACV